MHLPAENHPIWIICRGILLVIALAIVCTINYRQGFDWTTDPRAILIMSLVMTLFDVSKKGVYWMLRHVLHSSTN